MRANTRAVSAGTERRVNRLTTTMVTNASGTLSAAG